VQNSSQFRHGFIKTSQAVATMNAMMNLKSFLAVVLVPSCILIIPAAAMLFGVEGSAWDAGDFVLLWVIIAAAMAAYKFVASKTPSRAYRVAAGVAVGTGVILMWVNEAVGLIGSEDNPANLMYGGVLLVGLAGAAIARLQPLGMAWAMFATAVAQFLVPVVAMVIWRPDFSAGVVKVWILNFCFVLLFAGSGRLFRHAATGSQPGGVVTA
jgi:hypothetical protein